MVWFTDACDNDPGYWDLKADDVKSIARDEIRKAKQQMVNKTTFDQIIEMLELKDLPELDEDTIALCSRDLDNASMFIRQALNRIKKYNDQET